MGLRERGGETQRDRKRESKMVGLRERERERSEGKRERRSEGERVGEGHMSEPEELLPFQLPLVHYLSDLKANMFRIHAAP